VSTNISMEKICLDVPLRAHVWVARGERDCLPRRSAVADRQSASGAARGAAEAMVPHLYACVVPRVACWSAAHVPALVSMSAMRTLTMYSSEGFTERFHG
jgi:hypothetical protein